MMLSWRQRMRIPQTWYLAVVWHSWPSSHSQTTSTLVKVDWMMSNAMILNTRTQSLYIILKQTGIQYKCVRQGEIENHPWDQWYFAILFLLLFSSARTNFNFISVLNYIIILLNFNFSAQILQKRSIRLTTISTRSDKSRSIRTTEHSWRE